MGRTCAVPGCDSGLAKDNAQRKRLGLHRCLLFSIPKCNDRRSQWKKVLGCELDANQFVCQIHFSEESIKKSDKLVLKDGTVYDSPLARWRLNANAVPISQHHELMDIENNNGSIEQMERDDNAVNTEKKERQRSDPIVLNEITDAAPSVPTEPWMGEVLNNVEMAVTAFTTSILTDELTAGLLPESWAWTQTSGGVVFTFVGRSNFHPQLHLEVALDLTLQIRTNTDTVIPLNGEVTSMKDILRHLEILKNFPICSGTGIESESRDPHCMGILDVDEAGIRQRQKVRCMLCRRLRIKLRQRNKRRRKLARKEARAVKKVDLARRKFIRLKQKTEKVLADVADLKRTCSRIRKETLEESISNLPETQKEAVRTCFEAAKVKNRKGRRYTIQWIYECLLMRIKSSGLYDHIRDRLMLPLPCRETLNRYIQKISSSAYGFQTAIFECLKTKGSRMEFSEKRGTLLIDEMKLSEAVSFNKRTVEFEGFVDLGQYTPEEKRTTRADHALVFMFQPFRGSWVQVLGCFLTKDSVTSAILHKLILECIVLLANFGFHVDVVTTDGAQWNRGVWSIFGIKDGQFSCEHPCDRNKRLWMISDFPHLIKCFRNGFITRRSFQTPDGLVQKKHWEALLKYEQFMKPNLKVAYHLTPAHLNPSGYQKMNVPLAFQLFSQPIRVAMEIYRSKPGCPELIDSTATQMFCEKTDKLITAMMSRTPQNALRVSEDCPQKKAIIDFDAHLRDWESITKSKEMPISASTVNGLKVTLGATLEILEALQKEENFEFLMTARLNQDALERFFGMMRGALGDNEHPDPKLFAQLYRLLCSYSLIKPPKNSNVSGTELLEVLMQTKDSLADARQPRTEWLQKLDRLLEEGHVEDALTQTLEEDHDYAISFSMSTWKDSLHDHTYDVCRTSPEVQAYIAGYVVRKMLRQIKCQDCMKSLQSDNCEPDEPRDAMINLMNQYGGLLHPSDNLFRLTEVLESTILDVVGKFGITINTLHTAVERLSELKGLPVIGCGEHQQETTRRIVDFYVVMRGHFLAKSFNANNNEARNKTKRLRKNAKL